MKSAKEYRRYLPYEDDIVRATYPDYAAMLLKLPHRTRLALENRAVTLGVATTRRLFTGAEAKRLRLLRASGATWKQIDAAFPNRTRESLKKHVRCARMRLRRRYVETDSAAVNAIRARAADVGIGLTELDRRCGSRKAFGSGRSNLAVHHLVAAAELLGGTVEIVWEG